MLPIPASLAAFGGAHPGLTFSSFGFASHGAAVVPGLTAGLPIVLAAGMWAHGVTGATVMSPLLGALAVLAVGGLTGRLAGPQWAPAGAFLLALTVPEIYTSRSAFSDTLAQALLFGGLCLVVDSFSSRRPAHAGQRWAGCRSASRCWRGPACCWSSPVIPVAGALLAGRRPQAIPLSRWPARRGRLRAGRGIGLDFSGGEPHDAIVRNDRRSGGGARGSDRGRGDGRACGPGAPARAQAAGRGARCAGCPTPPRCWWCSRRSGSRSARTCRRSAARPARMSPRCSAWRACPSIRAAVRREQPLLGDLVPRRPRAAARG